MPVTHEDWSIPSESGEPLRVSSHTPESPRAHAVFAHGLKGFKDYGFIPVLSELLARDAGIAVHRFNLSHSGIGDDPSTFQRPDLFERDTWRTQARDIMSLAAAVRERHNAERVVFMGHSRGGASALLAAADAFERGFFLPSAVVTLSAPASLCRMTEADRARLLESGSLDMPSARTGQTLRVGRAWLQEQLDDPAWHDLPNRCASIACPVLVAHGGDDPTVPPEDAQTLAARGPDSGVRIIPGADHVWNTPNPAPPDAAEKPSDPLRALSEAIREFLRSAL